LYCENKLLIALLFCGRISADVKRKQKTKTGIKHLEMEWRENKFLRIKILI